MITVLKSGMLTTIQDTGRHGFQQFGVVASGSMDIVSNRIANVLVGNEEHEAVLEITLTGPTLRFGENALIALCGADLSPIVDGIPIRMDRPVFIKKGGLLSFGNCKSGSRTYLAVAGGFSAPIVMNSKSTYLRAAIGGFEGRALLIGDQLSIGTPSKRCKSIINKLSETYLVKEMGWSVGSIPLSLNNNTNPIRVMEGPQFHLFSKLSQVQFYSSPFQMTQQSDRMGFRIKGPTLSLENTVEMISEAVSFGTIQVPPNGNPIILLADRQTTGGYPKIGQIATIDLPIVAQKKPGDWLSFTPISVNDSQKLFIQWEQKFKLLKIGISTYLSRGV